MSRSAELRVASLTAALTLVGAVPASGPVGHRVESLVVPGSAQSELRNV